MVRTNGTRPSRQRLDPQVKARLLSIATASFARDGFHSASLNAILAEAGVGKSSFFYHYEDKEDLFASVVEDFFNRLASRVGEVPLPNVKDEVWAAAVDLLALWATAIDAEPQALGLLRALQPMRRTANPRLQGVLRVATHSFTLLLERGVELGAVRSDLDAATLMAMIQAVNVALDDVFFREPTPDANALRAHRTQVIDIIQRLLWPLPPGGIGWSTRSTDRELIDPGLHSPSGAKS